MVTQQYCPRFHLCKVLVLVIFALIVLQYGFSVIYEAHQLEPLFTINSSLTHHPRRSKLYRHRGLIFSSFNSTPHQDLHATNYSVFLPSSLSTIGNETTGKGPLCSLVPPNLDGPVKVNTQTLTMEEVEKKFPMLEIGGHYHPPDCQARDHVAIIVPYRNREEHLAIFLLNLHPFLQKQQLDYQILIVEQAGNGPFNRAMLMNVGFLEALKLHNFECFVFHDVDLLPEDDRNLYTCPEQPRHMSVAIDVFHYKLPYQDIFGGVSAMTRTQFETVNGFSNKFWGWGGEDDDMSNRIKFHKYYISRYSNNIARYKMLTHRKQQANPKRYEVLNTGRRRFQTDGLNSVKYHQKELKLFHTYTLVVVELSTDS